MAVIPVVRCTMSIRSAHFVVAAAATHGQGAVQPLVRAPANSKQLFPHHQLRRSFACSESSDSQLYAETKQNHCHWSSNALGAAGAVAGSVGAATQCAPGPGKEYWCMVCGEPHKQNGNAYVEWVCNAWQRWIAAIIIIIICFWGSCRCAGLLDYRKEDAASGGSPAARGC